jgi:hypothetical protein
VNRLHWRAAALSPDAEYVAAASANPAEHALFVWSTASGSLERILEGPPGEGVVGPRLLPFEDPFQTPC